MILAARTHHTVRNRNRLQIRCSHSWTLARDTQPQSPVQNPASAHQDTFSLPSSFFYQFNPQSLPYTLFTSFIPCTLFHEGYQARTWSAEGSSSGVPSTYALQKEDTPYCCCIAVVVIRAGRSKCLLAVTEPRVSSDALTVFQIVLEATSIRCSD